jgi:hypothetical protein
MSLREELHDDNSCEIAKRVSQVLRCVRSEHLDGPRQACHSQWLARVVSLSVQTFLFETRKLDLQETLQNLAWALCANIERAQFRARK